VPRRVIHCSDGIIEEYSTDEEEVEARKVEAEREKARKAAIAAIDPKKLAWVPWMVHYTWFAGSTLLTYCDFVGEKLAWFLGITSPKYYYELEEFKRMKLEEEERQKRQDAESAGWKASPDSSQTIDMDPAKEVGSDPTTDPTTIEK
jgi:hypothetical protein